MHSPQTSQNINLLEVVVIADYFHEPDVTKIPNSQILDWVERYAGDFRKIVEDGIYEKELIEKFLYKT